MRGFDIRYQGNIRNTHNKHLRRSIDKYGIDNFVCNKCLDIAFSREELNIKERLYIQKYDTYNAGYNMTEGGEGCLGAVASEESREKMRVAKLGANNPNYGKKFSEAIREKIKNNQPNRVRVICLNTGEVYDSISEASKHTTLESYTAISRALSGIRKTAGKHPVTGERLRWAYYEDYMKQQGAV